VPEKGGRDKTVGGRDELAEENQWQKEKKSEKTREELGPREAVV